MKVFLKSGNKLVEYVDGSAEVNVNDDFVQEFAVEPETKIINDTTEGFKVVFTAVESGNTTQELLLGKKPDGTYAVAFPDTMLAEGGTWGFQILRYRTNTTLNKTETVASYAGELTIGEGIKLADGSTVTAAVLQSFYTQGAAWFSACEEAKNEAVQAKNEANEAKVAATTARNNTLELKNITETAKETAVQASDVAVQARDAAISAKNAAASTVSFAQAYATTAAENANTAVAARDGAVQAALSAEYDRIDTNSFFVKTNLLYDEVETLTSSAREYAIDAEVAAIEAKNAAAELKADIIKPVTTLPSEGEPNKFYLVPNNSGNSNDMFDMYIWVNGKWEFEGSKEVEIDLSEYVKFTDYATSAKTGVIKLGAGLKPAANGMAVPDKASNDMIKAKTDNFRPIVSSNLDYAVKAGITTNTETWTDEEKASARATIGAVGEDEIETVLDGIIVIQNSLIGGGA